jgi:hypothetical protein
MDTHQEAIMKRTQLLLTNADVKAIVLALNDCLGEIADCDLHNKLTGAARDRMRKIRDELSHTKEKEDESEAE